jgi:hypothetical protein
MLDADRSMSTLANLASYISLAYKLQIYYQFVIALF